MGNRASASVPDFHEGMKSFVAEEIKILSEAQSPPSTSVSEFIEKSNQFRAKFPTETARVKSQHNHSPIELESYINSAYPVIHEKLLPFLVKFIYFKRIYGTKKERKIYKNLHTLDLIERLLKKRPMVFVGSHDKYVLYDGTFGAGGFELIGQLSEDARLPIGEYMTYDEIKLSALMSISSKSHFINNGSRNNKGEPGEKGTFERNGVIVGQVGPRFQKPHKMDWVDCVITPGQNTFKQGYGDNEDTKWWLLRAWSELWNLSNNFPTWNEVIKSSNSKYSSTLFDNIKFNKQVYEERIKMSADILLADANTRGMKANKKVYIHVVGLGLGEWKLTDCQPQIFVDSFGKVIEKKNYNHISCINFSWIPVTSCCGAGNGEKINNTDITVYFSKRSLHDPVPKNMMLVCNYAWDGNSLPGNEYWVDSLFSSGDPAAACSSGVAELQNAFINPQVSPFNLHICSNNEIIHVSEYAKMWLSKI